LAQDQLARFGTNLCHRLARHGDRRDLWSFARSGDFYHLARVFYEVQDPSIPLSWRGIRITNLGRENRLPSNLVGRIFCGVVYGPDLGFQTLLSIGIFIQPEGIFLFSWALLLADYSDF